MTNVNIQRKNKACHVFLCQEPHHVAVLLAVMSQMELTLFDSNNPMKKKGSHVLS